MVAVKWDYTERAANYDKRADYSAKAIDDIFEAMRLSAGVRVADVGAGTGKLCKELLKRDLIVDAVEPNSAMREIGIRNTAGQPVTWHVGTGETTNLQDLTYSAVFYGSSFNVVQQSLALKEAKRVLTSEGFFCCMWNHRDLDDPLQKAIEGLIKGKIPSYDYGDRRKDPSEYIVQSGLFLDVKSIEGSFVVETPKMDFIEAWKSHATLSRQAGEQMPEILSEIDKLIIGNKVQVPFTTRIWFSKLK